MDKYARFRYQICLPLGRDGKRVTACAGHAELSRRAAGEGMVLLKNDGGALPLEQGETVALFGKASIEYIKGGGGSGDVNCPYIRGIYEGMEQKAAEGRISVYEPLSEFYKKYVAQAVGDVLTQPQIDRIWDKVNAMPFCQERDDITYDTFARMHVPEPAVPDELIRAAAGGADTAVITLSRFSAEGTDRRPLPGDYYLSQVEKDLIDRACALFDKVVIVIDSGAVIDCEYFADNKKVQAVLFAWQGGMEGGGAIADILCGDVCPSGRLADTVAKSYDAYPNKDDFTAAMDHCDYTDDIYVGYRYFETIPGAKDSVRYPFGFGLSYTSFSLSGAVCGENGGRLTAAVSVKNTGALAGREVVQLYYSAPCGLLGKPSRELAAFKKTGTLCPGESETLALSFDIADMASFDDTGRIAKSALVLEKGKYSFYLGVNVREAEKLGYEYDVKENTVIKQLSSYCAPSALSRRLTAGGSYEQVPTAGDRPEFAPHEPSTAQAPASAVMFDEVGRSIGMAEFAAQLTDEELIYLVGGHGPTGVANTGCFGGLSRLGIPAVPTADGPAGLRLDTKTGIATTAWPCATLLACTWDPELSFEVGAAAAAELRENDLGVWLAPAMNIHRSPLCGRNFEYFSEDPLLAGKVCAGEVRGIQSQKIAASVKHFACNNKEVDRMGSDSRVSERALREIYLRGFEIVVKEASPWTVMSSYNLINGTHTSENRELLTGILRGEWGFKGMVETDWGVKNDPVAEVLAGNDMKMDRGYPEDLRSALASGRLTRADLEACVSRILTMFTHLAGEK